MDHSPHGFATRALHVGQEPDALTGAVVTPIYQVSTFKQDAPGQPRGGYEYSRSGNPTRSALEELIANLEGGQDGFAFASGIAAQDCILRSLLGPGDHVVVAPNGYNGTLRLLDKVASRAGIAHSQVSATDVAAVSAALRDNTKMVWLETPSNPNLEVSDIQAIAALAHTAGALLVVDNTLASPYLQQPIHFGADVVTHSSTKYCGGHSDVVGGLVVTASGLDTTRFNDSLGETAAQRMAFFHNATGAVAGPMDAWLVQRGLKSLAVRMERHCDNAERVAAFLSAHAAVETVLYPGLPDHPNHQIATAQMRRFGGMVSFRVRGGDLAARKVCEQVQLWTLGVSLGGAESLIEHPWSMTYGGTPPPGQSNITTELLRLSVGLEDVEDLIADLDSALTHSR